MKSLYIVILISLSALFTINCKDEYGFDPDEEARLVREAFAENGIHIPEDMNFFEGKFYFDYYNGESKLRYNKGNLTKLEPFTKIKSLSKIFISNTSIGSLEGISKFRNLTHMHADGTGLTKIPNEIKNCVILQNLQIQNNLISTLGSGLNELNIDTLIIYNNKLVDIPKKIFNNVNLLHLSLYENKIESLDLTELNLPKLQYIGLASNKLTQFPKALYSLKSLKELHIRFNKIDTTTIDQINLNHLERFTY